MATVRDFGFVAAKARSERSSAALANTEARGQKSTQLRFFLLHAFCLVAVKVGGIHISGLRFWGLGYEKS